MEDCVVGWMMIVMMQGQTEFTVVVAVNKRLLLLLIR